MKSNNLKIPFSQVELKSILKQVEEVSILAGKKLTRYQNKLEKLNVHHKKAQGVVSEADIKTEEYILKKLKNVVKDAEFLAEESCYLNKEEYCETSPKKDLLWVIDPLDGTTNFLAGMDYYAVCISLCHKGIPILGVIHRPRTYETYSAFVGGGSHYKVNGKKKRTLEYNKKRKLKDALLATGFATEKGEAFDREFAFFKEIMSKCRGVRRMGSAALDLCFVSQEIFDGFWEKGLAPWDMAAAAIICEEAGLKLSDYNGDKFSIFGETIVCGPKSIQKELQTILKD